MVIKAQRAGRSNPSFSLLSTIDARIGSGKAPKKEKIDSMSGTKPDDLAAVRTIVDTLNDFSTDEQQRILRWTMEKLGLTFTSPATYPGGRTSFAAPGAAVAASTQAPSPVSVTMDIK